MRIFSVATMAPSGRPPARGLATARTSGRDVNFLIGEVASGAAQAALNFIGDQRGVVLCG